MKILIAGGSGFIGTALRDQLEQENHDVFILTRRTPQNERQIQWDGKSSRGWGRRMNEMDAVVNLTGFGLEHWPWTRRQKEKFESSRVAPGRALVSAIEVASHRPRVLLQVSGINHYGLRGEAIADESTPAADDFLAQLTVKWEAATRPVEALEVHRIIVRMAVVLAKNGGLFPLMALPVRLFFGGKLGDGAQAVPWIHLSDAARAMTFLLQSDLSEGPYNLIAPSPTSNAKFMSEAARSLHRPYWFHVPKVPLKLLLGEMSVLLTEGRYAWPGRLLEAGFEFKFPTIEKALKDIYSK